MKIYKNDIVEIITHNYKSYNDIPDHELHSSSNMIDVENRIYAFIGQRFKVYRVIDSRIINKYFGWGIPIDHVIIYKSPIRNRIKRLINMIIPDFFNDRITD